MTWFELPLGKYNEIKNIWLDAELTDEDKLLYQIKILFNVDPLKLKATELHKYINEMKFLGEKVPKVKLKSTFNLGGNMYTLKKDLREITVAQWVDFQNFLKEGGDTDNYAKLLSVFFFPKGEDEYAEGYNVEQVRSDINNYLSIAEAMSIASFFLLYRRGLSIRFLLFTRRETLKAPLTRKQRRKVKKEFRKLIWATLFLGV